MIFVPNTVQEIESRAFTVVKLENILRSRFKAGRLGKSMEFILCEVYIQWTSIFTNVLGL